MKRTGLMLLLLSSCLMSFARCATEQIPKAPIPMMPTISGVYEKMLLNAGTEITKEALKHEVDWQGWGAKMIDRTK